MRGTTAVTLTVATKDETVLDRAITIDPDETPSIDSRITEPGQYELSVTSAETMTRSFRFAVDDASFGTGANLFVDVKEDDISILMKE